MKAKLLNAAFAWIGLAAGACWFLAGCASSAEGSGQKASSEGTPKVIVTPVQTAPAPAPVQTVVAPAPSAPAAAAAPVTPTFAAAPAPKAAAPLATAPTSASAPAALVFTGAPPPSARPKFSAAELEKLAAPIALYPDPLLAIVLPASTYPLEVVQAARFVKDTNNIPKVDQQPWDDKVKAVAKFPAVIAKMDAELDWTAKLGQAFLEQPMDLMNALQDLRAKAQAAGKLKTTSQQVVTVTNSVVERTYENQVVYVTNTVIQVEPASSQVVYVPTYNPSTVYVVDDDDDDEAAAAVISFGVGMAFGAAMWGHCDWHYGGCYWGHYPPPPPPMPPPYRPPPGSPPGSRPPPGNRPPGSQPPGNRPPGTQPPGARPSTPSTLPAQRWQPDQTRLSSAGSPSVSTREARGWSNGSGTRVSATPATGLSGARPSTANVGARPSTGMNYSGNRASGAPAVNVSQRDYSRPSSGSSSSRSAAPSYTRSSSSSGSAFSSTSSGASTRSYSNRGATSRSGGFSSSRSSFSGPRGGRR